MFLAKSLLNKIPLMNRVQKILICFSDLLDRIIISLNVSFFNITSLCITNQGIGISLERFLCKFGELK